MLKRAPVGIGNFAELVHPDNQYQFADRTAAIKQVVQDGKVIAFHTFRRGGKTLFASMLQHFFSPEVAGVKTRGLFDTLAIGKEPDFIAKYQGQYPVIMLSLKEVQENSFESAQNKIQEIVVDAYGNHRYLLGSPLLDEVDKINFRKILLNEGITKEKLERSLLTLARLLHVHHGKKVWVIIDEYDTPLTAAHRQNYLESMAQFMKNFFSAGLKDNDYRDLPATVRRKQILYGLILSGG